MTADGILIVDKEGVCRAVNPAAAAMFQIGVADLQGKQLADVFSTNRKLVYLSEVGGPTEANIVLPTERLAQGIAHDLPDGGRIVLLNDVTEQRQLDFRREALVTAVAHDLRNPLNAVMGYARLVDKFGALTERQSRFLDRVTQTTRKVWELADTLVNLAWIESGMPLHHIPFDLAELIQQVIGEQSRQARLKNTRLIISTQDTVPTIMGDPERMKQAITYLIDNAIQYSPPDTYIVIHCWQKPDEVFCSIVDQGFGIAEDDLELIWDRMWRSSDVRIATIPGGGIGLTYVKGVIERHGGQIWVESTVDKGSTFTFTLPLV